jgi:hypothetical protein
MLSEIVSFKSLDITPLHFILWGWMKSAVYERRVDTRDELLAGISDVAVRTKIHKDQLKRTTRYLHTRVAKCLEVDGVIFEN